MTLDRVRQQIAVEEAAAVERTPRLAPTPPPDWVLEHGIGTGRQPVRVHVGDRWDTRTRCKSATADVARRALAEGVEACTHCRPDTALGVLDRPRPHRLEGWNRRRSSCTESPPPAAGGW
ncbi:DUF6233 domain-containing protein [Streptomyces sp. NPDC093801]|uniref:DUF6233 domain-containing protein n=1 Tax=Streptomyces sp. NPDC093801 TaxID=3155203 RepID=UPI00344BD7ED